MGVQFQGFREQDDKCFHPSAVSPSVSLLVRSERGSVRSRCQEDKLFCGGSRAGRTVMYSLSALGWKPVEDVCFNKSFQQVIKVFSCFLLDTRVVFFFLWLESTYTLVPKNAQSSEFVKGLHSDLDRNHRVRVPDFCFQWSKSAAVCERTNTDSVFNKAPRFTMLKEQRAGILA